MRKREEKRTRRRTRRSRVAEGDGCSLQRKEYVWGLGLGFWDDFLGFDEGDGIGGMVGRRGGKGGRRCDRFFPVPEGLFGDFSLLISFGCLQMSFPGILYLPVKSDLQTETGFHCPS